MKPATYAFSTPFAGNNADALNIARVALLSLGFGILSESENELEASGPGMHSNQQPDLLGATHIHLRLSRTEISVNAILGGVDTMKRFVYFFPPALVISLLVMGSIFGDAIEAYFYLLIIPWIFIGRFIGKILEKTTTTAIDRLTRGMAQATKTT